MLSLVATSLPIPSAVIMQLMIVLVAGGIIISRMTTLQRIPRWDLVAVELGLPLAMWFQFGIGGLIAVAWPVEERTAFYDTTYSNFSVLLFSSYIFCGTLVYTWSVRAFSKSRADVRTPGPSMDRIFFVALIVTGLDWVIRVRDIQAGAYFTWLRHYSASAARSDALAQLQPFLWPIGLSLLVGVAASAESRTARRWALIVLGAEVVLLALTGSRRNLVFPVMIGFLAYGVIKDIRVEMGRLLMAALAGSLVLFAISPVIQNARSQMKLEGRSLMDNPESIPVRFVTEYIPSSASSLWSFRTRDWTAGSGLVKRLGNYPAFAASIQDSAMEGRPLLSSNSLVQTVTLVVPSALMHDKPRVDANARSFQHFGFCRPSRDACGTVMTDAFAHLHFPGVLVLGAVMGLLWGSAVRAVARLGYTGRLLMVAVLPALLITGDSFGYALTAVRNYALVMSMVAVLLGLLSSREPAFGRQLNNNWKSGWRPGRGAAVPSHVSLQYQSTP